jgi:hypothetical protein
MPQPRKPAKAKANKRPPLAWDGTKELKHRCSIYYNGERYDSFTAYDLNEGWFKVGSNTFTGSFIVKRID